MSRCRNYVWQDDLVDFVDTGLSEVRFVGYDVSVRSKHYEYAIPVETNTVLLDVRNPNRFALACGITVSEPELVAKSSVAVISPELVSIVFDVADTALGQTLHFTVSVSAPAEKRTFPDYHFSLPCHYPDDTGVDATFTLPDSASGTLQFTPASVTVARGAAALTVAASSNLALPAGTVWAWFVDGAVRAGFTTSSFLFDATAFAIGSHILSVTAETDAKRYSGSMKVTIAPAVTAPRYSVTYDVTGGNAALPAAQYAEGDVVATSASAGSRAGYTFSHWRTTDVDGGGAATTYSGGATFGMPARNVILTAVWSIVHDPVTALVGAASGGTVGLSWADPDSPELASVKVEWFPAGSGTPLQSLVAIPGAEGALVTGLNDGTAYTFRVFAVYTDGVSSVPATLSATPGVP